LPYEESLSHFEGFLTCRKILRHVADGFTSAPNRRHAEDFNRPRPGMNRQMASTLTNRSPRTVHNLLLEQVQRIFPLSFVSRPALRPIQPPVQWVPGGPFPGVKRSRGVTPTTHPHLVPRSIMSRSYTSSPPKRLHGM
jgi:hypothetical protein